jgi:CSLREA domain-containing protein/uncharacterized repeat protein (TIGR01451 family)/uncharacterized protein (TIGR03382 family)
MERARRFRVGQEAIMRPLPCRRCFLAARLLRLLPALCGLALAGPARSVTITVDSTADENSSSTPNGTCTLREAIISANQGVAIDGCAAGSGVDVIVLPAGTYVLTLGGIGEENAELGDLDITGNLTIQGAGASTTIIRGGGDRVFHVKMSASATLTGLTVEQGSAQFGGGIYVDGTLTLSRSVLQGCTATYGGGLLVSSIGTAQLLASTFTANTAEGGGGAIANLGHLTISNSTLSSNLTSGISGGGGGISNFASGTLTLTSTTIALNGNLAGSSTAGAEILNAGTVSMTDTLLVNPPGSQICSGTGTFTSGGHNLETEDTCHLTGPGDLPSTTAWVIGPLQDNGGGTPTHALVPDSPAIDAGSSGCPAVDQRGASRPKDGNADGIPACDVGAFEAETQAPRADLAMTVQNGLPTVAGGEPLGFGLTVSNAGPAAAESVVVTAAISAGWTFVRAVASQGSCTGSGPVTCTLGRIAAGASAYVTFDGTAPTSPGEVVASASATTSTTDPDPTNDSASASTTVGPPYPAVVITPASVTVEAGGTVTFNASGGTGFFGGWWISPNGGGGALQSDFAPSVNHPTVNYTAGRVAGLDVVHVLDDQGHPGTATVTVVVPASPSGGCSSGTVDASVLALVALLGLAALPRRRKAPGSRAGP